MNRSNVWWGIILILMGVLFMLDNMEVLDFGDTIRTYWPVFLVVWGLQLVLRKKPGTPPMKNESGSQTEPRS
ncbi:MAG TPA: DUF5668 domain-containing protein [Bacteroidota bacterium]|nr:DUF5668 domain-containing protein [Bacteroidota bacterium]